MSDVEEAFGRFVAAERPALLAQALRLTGDADRAEDAVQAALARVHRRWGRPGADPRAVASAAVADVAGRIRRGEQVLESLDAAPPPPPRVWRLGTAEAAADAVARSRRSRRLRSAAAAAVLAAAAVAVPIALHVTEPPPPVDGTPVHAVPVDAAPVAESVLTEPTRGTLAGDRAFVDAVRRVDWGPMVPPPVEVRQVALATDTPSGRVALVTGTVDEDLRGVWLTGPVGAAAGDLVAHVPPHLGPGRPASLLLGEPGAATLVVVAGRDDEIEVSPRLQVGPRGTVARTYRPVEDVDGVAVVPAGGAGTGTSVRVRHAGRVVERAAPEQATAPGPSPAVPGLEPMRPAPSRPAPAVVAAALAELAEPLAATPESLEPQLLWSGPLPLDGVPGTVAVLVGRSPGGGLLVTTWAGSGGRGTPCGVSTPPGTTAVAGLVVARTCALPDGHGRWLVVAAPPDAVRAAVLGRRGGVLTAVPLDGGGAVLRLPEGARDVRTLDPAGRALAEVPVAAAPVTPFGDYGGGPVR